MRKRNGFVSCEHIAGDADAAVWSVRGNDVCALAFLPAVARAELSPCGLTDLGDDLGRCADLLLSEGTAEPPTSFAGPGGFLDALRAREHRGAIAIVDPIAFLDREERIVKVCFGMLNAKVGAGFVHRSTGVQWGIGGAVDKRRLRITMNEHHVRIEHWQRFSLGHGGDLFGRHGETEGESASLAPTGFIRLTYLLHADGTAQAWCASSYLPSTWFYRDYVRTQRRDIEMATEAEVEATLRPAYEAVVGTHWACIDVSTNCVNAVA